MGGHVFVIQGDVRRVACDARLVSAAVASSNPGGWAARWASDEAERALLASWTAPAAWRDGLDPTGPFPASRPPQGPWLWPTHTGTSSLESIAEAAEAFVRSAGAALRSQSRQGDPPRYLLAMNLPGAGGRNAGHRVGAVVEGVLPRLLAAVRGTDVDLALVAWTLEQYDALQAWRRRHQDLCWARDELGDVLRTRAEALAVHARAGQLALLTGAGISVPAGLPTWERLLDRLCADLAGDPESASAVAAISSAADVLTKAELLTCLFRRRGERVGTRIAALIDAAKRHALEHALLANLPVREVVTLNYDCLFELAAEGMQASSGGTAGLTVLPAPDHETTAPGAVGRWLLKLHGSARDPASMVFSRRDYTGFDRSRHTWGAVLQTLLVTRHLLFVGFGLSDLNVLRLIDAVEEDVRLPRGARRGTVLTPDALGALSQLWEPSFDVVSTRVEPGDSRMYHRQRLFLDYLAAKSRDPVAHLLDESFVDALPEADRAVAKLTQEYAVALGNVSGSEAATEILRLLERLGHRPTRG